MSNWFFFFKQKTAYDMRISDCSSDVCSSDVVDEHGKPNILRHRPLLGQHLPNVSHGGAAVVDIVDEQQLAAFPGKHRQLRQQFVGEASYFGGMIHRQTRNAQAGEK